MARTLAVVAWALGALMVNYVIICYNTVFEVTSFGTGEPTLSLKTTLLLWLYHVHITRVITGCRLSEKARERLHDGSK